MSPATLTERSWVLNDETTTRNLSGVNRGSDGATVLGATSATTGGTGLLADRSTDGRPVSRATDRGAPAGDGATAAPRPRCMIAPPRKITRRTASAAIPATAAIFFCDRVNLTLRFGEACWIGTRITSAVRGFSIVDGTSMLSDLAA